MTRTLCVLAGILALPAMSLGFSPTLGVHGPNGANDSTVLQEGQAATISVTVVVDVGTPPAGVGAIQYALAARKGADDAGGLFRYASDFADPKYVRTTGTYLHVYDETGFLFTALGYISDPDGVFGYSLGTALRISPGEYDPGWTVGQTLAAAPDMEWIPKTQGANETPSNIFPANVVTYQLATDGLTAGTYTLTFEGRSNLPPKVCSGPDCVLNPAITSVYTIEVVPEPITAVLLLGLVPFLRRRRA